MTENNIFQASGNYEAQYQIDSGDDGTRQSSIFYEEKGQNQELEEGETQETMSEEHSLNYFRAMLIEEVRKFLCIWDIKTRGYKNGEMKKVAWATIAKSLEVNGKSMQLFIMCMCICIYCFKPIDGIIWHDDCPYW